MMKSNDFRSEKSTGISLCVRRFVSFRHCNFEVVLCGRLVFLNFKFLSLDFEMTPFMRKNNEMQIVVILCV